MMILRSDVNLDCFTLTVGGLPMENLKQAILQHEFVFRNQVRELHRLYWTQKNLMNELLQKGFEDNDPHRSSMGARAEYIESLVEKKAFSISSRARELESSLLGEVATLEEFKDTSANLFGTRPINFGVHLPSDDFVPLTAEELANKQLEHEVSTGTKIVDAIDRRNLGIGLGQMFIEKSLHVPVNCKSLDCHEEESVVLLNGFKAPLQKDTGVFGCQPTAATCVWSSLSKLLNNAHLVPAMVNLNEMNVGRLHEEKHTSPVNVLDNSCIATRVDQPTRKHQVRPLIDLNVPQEDESACPSDPVADNTFSLGYAIYEGKPMHELNNSCPKESSSALRPGSSYTATKIFCNKQADSLAYSSEDFEVTANNMLGNKKTDCMENDEVLESGCHVPTESSKLPVKEPTASAVPVFPSINLISSSSMDWCELGKNIVDSPSGKCQSTTHSDSKRIDSNMTSSSISNVTQTATRELANKLCNACNSLEASAGQPATFSITDDSVTTQLNSSKDEGYTSAKLNREEQDANITTAAEALMSISSGKFDCVPVVVDESEDRSNQAQCSPDTFECMTLQLSEIQSEDQLMLPEPPSLNNAGKNDVSLSMRRGRGLRDFQKEILPGLVSLSRHEICEDLHNIGYNLRGISCKSSSGNWFLPVRSRRSSRLCAGRRRH